MAEEVRPASYLKVSGRVQLYELPKDFTFADYQRLSPDEREKYLIVDGPNLVVNGGADQFANLMLGINTDSFTLCQVGSSSTAVTAGQTALVAIIGAGVTITNRYLESVGKAHFDTFFGSGDNNGTWRETALLTTGLVMLCRKVIPDFVKSGANTAVIAWTLTLTPVP